MVQIGSVTDRCFRVGRGTVVEQVAHNVVMTLIFTKYEFNREAAPLFTLLGGLMKGSVIGLGLCRYQSTVLDKEYNHVDLPKVLRSHMGESAPRAWVNNITAGNVQRGVPCLRLRVYLCAILQELGSHLHSVLLRT